jgi:hypothetical protein
MTASAGYAAQLGLDTTSPGNTSTMHRFEFASCMLGAHESIIDANGIVGSRSRDIERVRGGLVHVNGVIEMEPTALEWSLLLPWLMGGTTSGSPAVVYSLGDQMPTQFITVDKVAKVFTYSSCAVNRFTLTGAQGQALKLRIEVIGAVETEANAGTFTTKAIDLTTAPFVFSDAVVTAGGTGTLIKNFELSVDNHIDADRFFNSVTLATPPLALDRTTTFRTLIAFDSVLGAAIYGTGVAGSIIDINHTNGSQTLNIAMPAVSFPRQGLDVAGRTEVMMPIEGTAYRRALASELVVTSNPGP